MLLKYCLKTAVLLAFFFGSVAWAAGQGIESAPVFPGTSIILEDGDVILNDGLGIISTFNKKFGHPEGPYTHASVFVVLPKAGGRVIGYNDEGIHISKPQGMFSRNYRLALLRPATKPPAGALADAYQALTQRPLKFDYNMAWPSIDSSQTYCVGFISQLFQIASPAMKDFFLPPKERPHDFWSEWTKQNLDFNLSQIASPNIFLSNPNFRLIAEYQSDDRGDLVNNWIRRVLIDKIEIFIRDARLDIAPPKLGSRLALFAARAGIIDGITFAQMPDSFQDKFISIYEFMVSVELRTKRTMRLNDDHTWDEKAISALTGEVADSFRNEFFISPKAR